MAGRDIYHYSMDLVQATEAAALSAGRWMGLGDRTEADNAATTAMLEVLERMDIQGRLIAGEESKIGGPSLLRSGQSIGTGQGREMDVAMDPVDGRNLLAQGRPGAMSLVAMAPRGAMWAPPQAIYMEKLIVNHEVAEALVPECMNAPAAWTLALVARQKKKEVRDLVVFVLDRARHAPLISEIREAGARVMLRSDGDVVGAMLAASRSRGVDVLMGTGGVTEGIIAACAVKAMGGAMLGRLAPQSKGERAAVRAADHDLDRILTCDELVSGEELYFAATGVTDGPLLGGVEYRGERAETESLIIDFHSRRRRVIHTEHWLNR